MKKAFSLIELLVVISVVAIIIAIAIPAIHDIRHQHQNNSSLQHNYGER